MPGDVVGTECESVSIEESPATRGGGGVIDVSSSDESQRDSIDPGGA